MAGVKWYGSNVENREKGLPRFHSDGHSERQGHRCSQGIHVRKPDQCIPYRSHSGRWRKCCCPSLDSKVLGVVGPGFINNITIETFAALRPSLDTLKIKGRGRASIDRCIAYVKEHCPQFKNIIVCDTMEECCKDADIMTIAVSTPTGGHANYPFIQREWLKPGCLVCAPGAVDFPDELSATRR